MWKDKKKEYIDFYKTLDSLDLGLLKAAEDVIVYVFIREGKVKRSKLLPVSYPERLLNKKLDLFFAIQNENLHDADTAVHHLINMMPYLKPLSRKEKKELKELWKTPQPNTTEN